MWIARLRTIPDTTAHLGRRHSRRSRREWKLRSPGIWCIVDGNYGSAVAAYLGGAKAVGCTIVNTPSDAWPALRGNNSTDKDPTQCLAFNTAVQLSR